MYILLNKLIEYCFALSWYHLGAGRRDLTHWLPGEFHDISKSNFKANLSNWQVLELMQKHPKERLRRVILTGIWFNAINVGY